MTRILNFMLIFMTYQAIIGAFLKRKCIIVTILTGGFFHIYILQPTSKFILSKYGSNPELVTKYLRDILKDETQNIPSISSSVYYSNSIAITFKFNRNLPVQILQVTMEFVAIASFEFLFRTQWTRLPFIWKYN